MGLGFTCTISLLKNKQNESRLGQKECGTGNQEGRREKEPFLLPGGSALVKPGIFRHHSVKYVRMYILCAHFMDKMFNNSLAVIPTFPSHFF